MRIYTFYFEVNSALSMPLTGSGLAAMVGSILFLTPALLLLLLPFDVARLRYRQVLS